MPENKTTSTSTHAPAPAQETPIISPKPKQPGKKSHLPVIITIIIVTVILAVAAVIITLILVNNQNGSTSDNSDQSTQTSKKDDTGDDNPKGGDNTPKTRANSRDTQREQDVARFSTALSQYQTNNRGSLPDIPERDETVSIIGFLAKDGLFTQGNNSHATASWGKFYYNYLFPEDGDDFRDPQQDDDDAYNLKVVNCDASSSGVCSTQPAEFDEQNYTLLVVVGAECKDDVAVKSTASNSSRRAVVMYTGESDQVFCSN